jgi:dihydrolipoamide dehydrogenase
LVEAMKIIQTEVAVVGAGTAGLAAYRAAIAAGARALIIEGGPYGTTCARVGCMPSKLLIAAAEAAHGIAKWPEFGLQLDGTMRVNGAAVMQRVSRERDRFVDFVLEGVEAIPQADRIRGYARFIDDHTLRVDDHTEVAFSRAVIATGSSPSVPDAWRHLGDRLVVNDDIFAWRDLPRAVAVFGPGVIGLELGQALHRLGVHVTMFGHSSHVGPFSDPDIRAYAARTFRREFPLHLEADVKSMQVGDDGVAIRHVNAEGRDEEIVVDYVVAATGRKPNVRNLGLENTSVKLGPRGVPEFDRHTMRSAATHIFVAGDASDDAPLLHEAADEGRIAGDNAGRYPHVNHGLRRATLGVVFTDPQLAVVGARFVDLAPGTFVVGTVSFENQGRSRVMLRNQGVLHVYADRGSGHFVGAEMIGPDAEHIAHLLAWSLQANMTIAQMLDMPFYHPVVEEGLRTALRDAAAKLGASATPTVLRAAVPRGDGAWVNGIWSNRPTPPYELAVE